MLYEVLGDIWVVQRNPYLQDDLLDNPKRRASWSRRCTTAWARSRSAARPATTSQRDKLVGELLVAARAAVQASTLVPRDGRTAPRTRLLRRYTAKDNIKFDGLSRVSHVTDATDWRVEYPFVVLTPDTEAEMAGLVKGCIELGLTIIPRGGGTGYTGGAIPLTWKSAVINTEKLEAMTEVADGRDARPRRARAHHLDRGRRGHAARGRRGRARRLRVRGRPDLGRGVLHRRQRRHERRRQEGRAVGHGAGQPGVLAHGDAAGRVAGGHAPGPQPGQDPRRRGRHLRAALLRGRRQDWSCGARRWRSPGRFRKEGLGKDVTDKFLSGLPGIQKEGCDGLITSARWVVHRMPAHTRTVCLEFFGNAKDAVPSIVEIKDFMFAEQKPLGRAAGRPGAPGRPLPEGRGLRHQVQARRPAEDGAGRRHRRRRPDAVARATSEVVRIANSRSGEGFIAISPEARKKFWLDRKRTAAISKHTNAFKINEDVVIPLPRMAEYTDGIERINIELSLRNKIQLADELVAFFARGNLPLGKQDDANEIPSAELLEDRVGSRRWRWCARCARSGRTGWRTSSAVPAAAGPHACARAGRPRCARRCRRSSRARRSRRSWSRWTAIHKRVLKGRVWVALHMHAGDGNVHTNIPVNSDDYEMLQTAHEAVKRIMALARSLDGVISGEHGIGITKLEFLTDEEIAPFADYKQRVDPEGRFNKGKLLRPRPRPGRCRCTPT
jgi:FAD/FMN-containing dehydrogenase